MGSLKNALTRRSKAYKEFKKEFVEIVVTNDAPEMFFRDGQRVFSETEQDFLELIKEDLKPKKQMGRGI